MPGDPEQMIEAYLSRLRRRLRGLPDEDVGDIVKELRSHIIDRAAAPGQLTAAGVEAALAALGSPEALACQYITDDLLGGIRASRSPLQVLDRLFRWATLSLAGCFALLGSAVGYCLGLAFVLCAALKPLHPHTAGLWVIPEAGDTTVSLQLGFGSAPESGREVLGWWIVPIGLLIGWGLVILTTHFAQWCARLYRGSRPLPRG